MSATRMASKPHKILTLCKDSEIMDSVHCPLKVQDIFSGGYSFLKGLSLFKRVFSTQPPLLYPSEPITHDVPKWLRSTITYFYLAPLHSREPRIALTRTQSSSKEEMNVLFLGNTLYSFRNKKNSFILRNGNIFHKQGRPVLCSVTPLICK